MRCREAESWISSRIDGESIPHGALEALGMHLAACPGCSRFLRDEEERALALGDHLAAGDTQPLARAVMARVRAGEAEPFPELPLPARPARAPFLRPLALAAAALLAVGALVFLPDDPEPPVGPGNEVAGDGGTTLIYFRDAMAPPADGSPLEKEVRERHQVILAPVQDGGPDRPVPDGSGQRQYMQYQKLTDYHYY